MLVYYYAAASSEESADAAVVSDAACFLPPLFGAFEATIEELGLSIKVTPSGAVRSLILIIEPNSTNGERSTSINSGRLAIADSINKDSLYCSKTPPRFLIAKD